MNIQEIIAEFRKGCSSPEPGTNTCLNCAIGAIDAIEKAYTSVPHRTYVVEGAKLSPDLQEALEFVRPAADDPALWVLPAALQRVDEAMPNCATTLDGTKFRLWDKQIPLYREPRSAGVPGFYGRAAARKHLETVKLRRVLASVSSTFEDHTDLVEYIKALFAQEGLEP